MPMKVPGPSEASSLPPLPGCLARNPVSGLEASSYAHRAVCLACYIVFKLLTAEYFSDSFLKFKLDSFCFFYNTLRILAYLLCFSNKLESLISPFRRQISADAHVW